MRSVHAKRARAKKMRSEAAHLHPQVRDALRVGLPAWFTYFLLAYAR